ncbi:YdcF family protein [Pelagibacterales bacterium SAG-MED23]|nr:YdcF family protein [Pelagibacterales bacterium SAG-MED23]
MYYYLSKFLGPLLNPTNILFIILIILFIFYLISKRKIILKILILNLFLIIIIAFFPTGSLGLKYLEKEFKIEKKYKNIKNILVLSGADERIIASISLAYQYPDSKIFYVGGNAYLVKNKDNDDPTIARKFYSDLNFDMDRINFIGKSRNTIENFKEIKELNLKYSETILITSAYHMKRSMMIAKKQGVKVNPYPVNLISRSKTPMLNSYQGFDVTYNLSKFNTFFREILGIIAFKITN